MLQYYKCYKLQTIMNVTINQVPETVNSPAVFQCRRVNHIYLVFQYYCVILSPCRQNLDELDKCKTSQEEVNKEYRTTLH